MLRVRVMASVVPLLLIGVVARSELRAGPQPCIVAGDSAVRLATLAWQAQLHVGFTDDPARATVRVQIVDRAEDADFTMIDDPSGATGDACSLAPETRLVAIAAHPSATDPVVYLTRDADADYRIFVRSNTFSLRDAAALLVGASERSVPITTASIGSRS
jgi:hypothetical protein